MASTFLSRFPARTASRSNYSTRTTPVIRPKGLVQSVGSLDKSSIAVCGMRTFRVHDSGCATNVEGVWSCSRDFWMRDLREMKVGPLRNRPMAGGSKPPRAALAEDRRGERRGKGAGDASGGDQEDGAQSRRSRSPLRCRYRNRSDIKTGAFVGCPGISPAGAR